MIHPDTALRFINPDVGYGVCATELIPQGTIVWVQDALDIVISPEKISLLNPMLQQTVEHYAFVNGRGQYVLCWDAGRYINHCCEPTTVSIGNFCTMAARDIHPGQELTEDYSTLNISSSLNCLCGAEKCRSQVKTQDLSLQATLLDARAELAMLGFLRVTQPLLALLPSDYQSILQSVARGERKAPSCLDNLYADSDMSQAPDKSQEKLRGLWARS